jgi:predicted Zn-dependent protease
VCTLTSLCESQTSQAVINIAGSALFAKYSREDEAQADSEAVVNVINAGIDPHGIPEMFRILIRDRRYAPNQLDAFFASHPLEESRVARTEAQIEEYDQHRLGGLTIDHPSFHAFQQALAMLPVPPRRRVPAP